MARVRCFEIAGVQCYWISGDHDPPHFHARRPGEWHYVVNFLQPRGRMLRVKREVKRIAGSVRRALCTRAEANLDALLDEWQRRHEGL